MDHDVPTPKRTKTKTYTTVVYFSSGQSNRRFGSKLLRKWTVGETLFHHFSLSPQCLQGLCSSWSCTQNGSTGIIRQKHVDNPREVEGITYGLTPLFWKFPSGTSRWLIFFLVRHDWDDPSTIIWSWKKGEVELTFWQCPVQGTVTHVQTQVNACHS